MSFFSALIVAVLFSVGVYLLLQRTLSRIILGLALMGHSANLLLMVVGGRAGQAPICTDCTPSRSTATSRNAESATTAISAPTATMR